MSQVSMTGNDTIMINNQIIANLADGDCVDLTYPNDIAQVKTGKDGNALFALNASGKQAEVKIRIIRGSSDDKFLNNLLNLQDNNFAGTTLLIGQFIKKIGDGLGNVGSDVYILGGGVFSKKPEAKSNVEGNTDQSVVIHTIRFSSCVRVLT